VKSGILCKPLGAIDHHTSPLRRGAKMGFLKVFFSHFVTSLAHSNMPLVTRDR
jgi:hypothetical protein